MNTPDSVRPGRPTGRALRDWKPGDGIHCAHAKKAPREIPCGPPVKSSVQTTYNTGRRSDYTLVLPLCAHHSGLLPAPSQVMVEARKVAAETLIANHWDEYHGYLAEAIRVRVDPDAEPGGSP